MIAAILAATVQVVLCALDLEHCARWVRQSYAPHGLVCADINLRPRCELVAGVHLHAQGIPVCTRACGDDPPSS